MMTQSRAESTRDTCNYGQYINQFPPNTIKVIREFERIQKKICRHKMSIMFNEICINEEMLPKYTYIHTYIYIYIYIYTDTNTHTSVCVKGWLNRTDPSFQPILWMIHSSLRKSRLICGWNEYKSRYIFPKNSQPQTSTLTNLMHF